MSSIFNYDILSNFRYTDIFFYHSLDHRLEINHKIDHASSDIVANALKMGEKRFQYSEHKDHPNFMTTRPYYPLKFSTAPAEALRLANADEPDEIDDIDDLVDVIKFNAAGAADGLKGFSSRKLEDVKEMDIGAGLVEIVAG